jgi:uncharacterized protein YmfQ (DUF2313 family)
MGVQRVEYKKGCGKTPCDINIRRWLGRVIECRFYMYIY